MRFRLSALLTICGFLIFALTMTFVPVLPIWGNYAARAGFLVFFGALWWVARDGHPLSRYRPVFFAYFTAVFGLSLGFFFADRELTLFRLTTQTPIGIAIAKFLQASLIVIGILAVARLSGEDLASLYIRKGRLILGLSVGLITAAACLVLTLLQPAIRSLGTAKLISLAPWILLFVVSNAFMEELLFRGLFLGRYEPLIGKWLAILSTGLAFTLAHMQVTYAKLMVFSACHFRLLDRLGVADAEEREPMGFGLVPRRCRLIDHFAHLQQSRRRVMQTNAKSRFGLRLLQITATFVWWIGSLFVSAGHLDWVRGWISVALWVVGMAALALIVRHYNSGLVEARAKWRHKDTKPFDKIFLAVYLPLVFLGKRSQRYRQTNGENTAESREAMDAVQGPRVILDRPTGIRLGWPTMCSCVLSGQAGRWRTDSSKVSMAGCGTSV